MLIYVNRFRQSEHTFEMEIKCFSLSWGGEQTLEYVHPARINGQH